MLAKKVFFSFLELTDAGRHREFNEYHQLDHRPANLALPGVVWGDRWVRTPVCRAASSGASERLGSIHYVAMYWFADPVSASVAEWEQLGERAFQWGRRPETDWARRQVGYFVPLKGYVNPRVRVSEDVLPFRPVRGVHVIVSEAVEPHASVTERLWSWYDRVRIPALLTCDGVAGAWTFYSEWSTLGDGSPDQKGRFRVTLVYLDQAPDVWLADRRRRSAGWEGFDTPGAETILLDSPLEPIVPWHWDWFDSDER